MLTAARREHEILELSILNSAYAGRSLRSLGLGGDVLVLSVRRGMSVLIPHGQTVLEYGDHLALLGGRESLAAVRERLEG